MSKNIRNYIDKYFNVSNDNIERVLSLVEKCKDNDIKRLNKLIKIIRSITWNRIHLTFYMEPKATARPRLNGYRKIFYVKDALHNSLIFKEFIEQEDSIKDIIVTPCRIKADFYMPIQESASKIFKILAELGLVFPISKPDLDNVVKTYMDMMQKHLLLDDSLVIELHLRKFYSLKPRIEMKIEYMDDFDCKENENKIKKWKHYKDLSS